MIFLTHKQIAAAKCLPLIIACLFFLPASAQYYSGPSSITLGKIGSQVKLLSGNIAALKNVKTFNIIYNYDHMAVGKFATEEEYLADKMAKYNEKEPGKGEEFRQNWINDRKGAYENWFQTRFNEVGLKAGISGSNDTDTNHVTLTVITTMTEPGFNTVVVKKPAFINVICTFKDASGQELLSYGIDNARGGADEFDARYRIAESYDRAAKLLVKKIRKELRVLKKAEAAASANERRSS